MIRTLDAAAFNTIANHPEVRPWLGGTEPIDLTSLVADPANFAFLTDEGRGGYFYHRLGVGLYEVHTLALPEGRGRQMLEARSASLREMFVKTDAVEIVTKVPEGNAGAAVWAQKAGFREVFTRPKAFDLMGELVGVSYLSLSYGDWVLRDRTNLRNGRTFHAMIHQFTVDDHGEDPVHDAWVGATIEGCDQANAEKAITLYNRWSAHAGYEPIQVLTARPLVLDIRTCILQNDADGLHVLHVRSPAPGATSDLTSEEASCPLEPSPLLSA